MVTPSERRTAIRSGTRGATAGKARRGAIAAVGVALAPVALPAQVIHQPAERVEVNAEAARLYEETCAECHTDAGDDRVPGRALLGSLSPRAIVASLEDGAMRAEGEDLTPEQRILIAEYLSGRAYSRTELPESAFCAERGFGPLDLGRVAWMGYGGDLAGTGFQSGDRAGLTAADIPGLELRWAFAFPEASQVRTKPTVVDDVILVGGPFGEVLALEADSGCVRWSFAADAGIRGSVLVGEGVDGRAVAYFVDFRTNAYALDVGAGELLWKWKVGWHPTSNTTGSPALHDGKLFVPISSMEVAQASDPTYPCCTASGAVAALDASTGDVLWYHRVIPGYPEEVGVNEAGTTLFGPSGAPVWSSPTVDPGRGRLYVGTGENYTRPTTPSSDAILALDIGTGEVAWTFQGTSEDAFTMACTNARTRANCPAPPGPDHDFGMAPMLVTRADGKEILVAGQKSGVVWALDPDAGGEVVWATRVGKGGMLGGIHWGMATDGRLAYAANADRGAVIVDVAPDVPPSPGLYALDLITGEVFWSAPVPEHVCTDRPRCHRANSAAPTVIPGVVFAGGLDGYIRAYDTADGSVLWAFDTARDFATTSGVPGRGGSIDGPGPVVAGGMLFVNSGYATFGQMGGNVLLAFGPGG